MKTKLSSSYYLVEITSYEELGNISKDIKRELEEIEDMAKIHSLNVIKVDSDFRIRGGR